MSRSNTPAQPPVSIKTASLYNVNATYGDGSTILASASRGSTPAGLARIKAAQLQALLMMTYGESSEAFSSLHNEMRDSLMWLASDLALDIRVLCDLAEQGGAA